MTKPLDVSGKNMENGKFYINHELMKKGKRFIFVGVLAEMKKKSNMETYLLEHRQIADI